MALQHFYSRVPARVSMYNKTDGFDTFAVSEGIDREFAEKEIASVCENKMLKVNVDDVRTGKMPSVYTQSCTRSGIQIQNCISYISRDYTGERSAYLSHTLVLNDDETRQMYTSKDASALNVKLFKNNIDVFDITSPTAIPVGNYPALQYVSDTAEHETYVLADFDKETVKTLLYTVLCTLCGKGKNVCIRLPGDSEEQSLKAVRIFNEILSLLPHQLRGGLSFASYVTDPMQYSAYKLRGVSTEFPENATKYVFVDLQTAHTAGIQPDEVAANKQTVNFFYEIIENAVLRREFLSFMEGASEAIPALCSLNMKVLANLVYLFRCSCGMYSEQDVLPNDSAVYDYLCAYEKYRAALSEEYRKQLFSSLKRYPEGHVAIPKNIFAKVARLYPSESVAAKRTVMNAVLELIHTDIMRDKLFVFIRNNYTDEDDETKKVIISDLCRVFYGGFLQNQLLNFFSEQFETESDDSKTMILEKLLLSIRTPAVQGKILTFIEDHYGEFSEKHKDSFYDTFVMMLPEGDKLAVAMVNTVNLKIETETDTRRDDLASRIIEVLEADYRKREHVVMPTLVSHIGFCRDLVIRLAYGTWQTRRLRDEYTELLKAKSLEEKADSLVSAFALVPELDREKLFTEAKELMCGTDAGLVTWLELSSRLATLPREFSKKLHESLITPGVISRSREAFEVGRTDVMPLLEAYAAEYSEVAESEGYAVIREYRRMIDAAQSLDYRSADGALAYLLTKTEYIPMIIARMEKHDIAPAEQSRETVLCLDIAYNMLTDGAVRLGALYRKRSITLTAEDAMRLMLDVCTSMSTSGETLRTALLSADADHEGLIDAFGAAYGKGWQRELHGMLVHGSEFCTVMEEALRSWNKKNGSIIAKLFGKNK